MIIDTRKLKEKLRNDLRRTRKQIDWDLWRLERVEELFKQYFPKRK